MDMEDGLPATTLRNRRAREIPDESEGGFDGRDEDWMRI